MNILFLLSLLFPFTAFNDAPEPWQMGFQDPATPIMQGLIDLHHDVTFFIVFIGVFVLWMIARTVYHFNAKNNPIPEKIIHGTAIEIAWTVTPSLILVLIAIPSFALLYSLDEVVDPAVTIKAIGHQNFFILKEYKALHPDCESTYSEYNDHYMNLIMKSAGCQKEDIAKVIKKLVKEIVIVKQ